ncbi:Alginate O-acetyl transferase AlgF [Roseibium album]|nr:Alginate O-acetyl transferase AlgF [Roseibium album]
MRTKFFSLVALVMIAFQGAVTSVTADDALYEAPIPADKSLVRFVNAKLKNGIVLDFSGQKFGVDGKALSAYHIIQNGDYVIGDGLSAVNVKLESGKFYTVAVGAEIADGVSIVVIEDKAVENPSKSALSFYNYARQPVDLALVLKGDTRTLFKDAAPGSMASRELPAIDIGLQVQNGTGVIFETDSVSLTADKRQNVVVLETAAGVGAYLVATELNK